MPVSSQRSASGSSAADATTDRYFGHLRAPRVNTDAIITKSLAEQYPELELVVVPESPSYDTRFDLLGFASAGYATVTPLSDDSSLPSSLQWTVYAPPARRIDGDSGSLGDLAIFGKFLYKWDDAEFIVYLVDGRDGTGAYPTVKNYYILTANRRKADELVLKVGSWSSELHNEAWVFDGGSWEKSSELWQSANKSTWDAVILDEDMKQALIEDHLSFFQSRQTYTDLKVPWKRGVIYHGPPGNGKTISIKATMHMLWDRTPSIPSLYVRTLQSYLGPEYGLKVIFNKARAFAPCYLIFEDLDTIISDDVRSYFLNEMDGLKSNDGIFIVGSTNHLDRLDPGISKRPSRFDRKYYFPDPSVDQREAYCRFWQGKLKDNPDIEFPDRLCRAIAEITDKFSFAYMQEAFVAALLAIARTKGERRASSGSEAAWVLVEDDEEQRFGDELDKLVLWVEMKKQVNILREGLDTET